MVTERQEKILNNLVADYINLAQPISSKFLEKKHSFGLSPATIRNEMQELTKKGYIFQPHTSAGRVPTDKGYRFFVDKLLESQNSFHPPQISKKFGWASQNFGDLIDEIFEEGDIFKLANRLTRFIAEETSSLTILNLPERDFVFKEGWEELSKEAEFFEKDFFADFAKAIEKFEQDFKDLKVNSEIKVYIGRENKVPKARNLSVISSKCKLPNKEKATLTLVGPKRMNYNRNLSLVQSLNKYLEHGKTKR